MSSNSTFFTKSSQCTLPLHLSYTMPGNVHNANVHFCISCAREFLTCDSELAVRKQKLLRDLVVHLRTMHQHFSFNSLMNLNSTSPNNSSRGNTLQRNNNQQLPQNNNQYNHTMNLFHWLQALLFAVSHFIAAEQSVGRNQSQQQTQQMFSSSSSSQASANTSYSYSSSSSNFEVTRQLVEDCLDICVKNLLPQLLQANTAPHNNNNNNSDSSCSVLLRKFIHGIAQEVFVVNTLLFLNDVLTIQFFLKQPVLNRCFHVTKQASTLYLSVQYATVVLCGI